MSRWIRSARSSDMSNPKTFTRSTPDRRSSHCCKRAFPRKWGQRRNIPATFPDGPPDLDGAGKSELKVEEGGAFTAIDAYQTNCEKRGQRQRCRRTPPMRK